MQHTSRRRLAATALVLTLSMLCVVGVAGPAAAQSGAVSLTDEITPNSQVFDVEVTSVQETQTGCLEVTNLDTGAVFRQTEVAAGDRFSVSGEEVGGFESGHVIEATLYEEPFDCFTELSRDTRTVQAGARFAVTVDETTSPVIEGERFEVTATVENTGNERDTRSVDLQVDGERQDRLTLTLEAGESRQVQLVWGTQSGDAGPYQATVASPDSEDITSVLVEEPDPANVSVAVDATTSPVFAGESLNVTATAENTGDVVTTRTVALRVGGSLEDDRLVTLDGGESRQVQLRWETGPGDVGTSVANLTTDDDTATTDVAVEEQQPAKFAVTIDSTTSPVFESDPLAVTATVENTGGATGTGTVALRVDTGLEDDRSVTLAGGESRQIQLHWETGPGDAGTHRTSVAIDGQTASTNVSVLEAGGFEVSVDTTTAPVVEGDPLEVGATVQNTGSTETTEPVVLRVGNRTVDTSELSLPGGDTQRVELRWQTETGDTGEYELEVTAGNDTDSTPVGVLETVEFPVELSSTNAPVTAGNELFVTGTVTNTGDVGDTRQLTLAVGGSERDARNVTLGPGESRRVTLSWATADTGSGEYGVELATPSDSAGATVTLTETDCGDSFPLVPAAVLVLALVLATAGGVSLYYRRQRRPPL